MPSHRMVKLPISKQEGTGMTGFKMRNKRERKEESQQNKEKVNQK